MKYLDYTGLARVMTHLDKRYAPLGSSGGGTEYTALFTGMDEGVFTLDPQCGLAANFADVQVGDTINVALDEDMPALRLKVVSGADGVVLFCVFIDTAAEDGLMPAMWVFTPEGCQIVQLVQDTEAKEWGLGGTLLKDGTIEVRSYDNDFAAVKPGDSLKITGTTGGSSANEWASIVMNVSEDKQTVVSVAFEESGITLFTAKTAAGGTSNYGSISITAVGAGEGGGVSMEDVEALLKEKSLPSRHECAYVPAENNIMLLEDPMESGWKAGDTVRLLDATGSRAYDGDYTVVYVGWEAEANPLAVIVGVDTEMSGARYITFSGNASDKIGTCATLDDLKELRTKLNEKADVSALPTQHGFPCQVTSSSTGYMALQADMNFFSRALPFTVGDIVDIEISGLGEFQVVVVHGDGRTYFSAVAAVTSSQFPYLSYLRFNIADGTGYIRCLSTLEQYNELSTKVTTLQTRAEVKDAIVEMVLSMTSSTGGTFNITKGEFTQLSPGRTVGVQFQSEPICYGTVTGYMPDKQMAAVSFIYGGNEHHAVLTATTGTFTIKQI